MYETIAFIETIGSDARLCQADASERMAAMLACTVTAHLQSAIFAGDGHTFAEKSGITAVRACLLFAYEDDKDEGQEFDRGREQEIIGAEESSLIT